MTKVNLEKDYLVRGKLNEAVVNLERLQKVIPRYLAVLNYNNKYFDRKQVEKNLKEMESLLEVLQ